jgi:hypothetical protein
MHPHTKKNYAGLAAKDLLGGEDGQVINPLINGFIASFFPSMHLQFFGARCFIITMRAKTLHSEAVKLPKCW